MSDDRTPSDDGRHSGAVATEPPVYAIADLVRGGREAVILHDGQRYRLSITANRKLILTK